MYNPKSELNWTEYLWYLRFGLDQTNGSVWFGIYSKVKPNRNVNTQIERICGRFVFRSQKFSRENLFFSAPQFSFPFSTRIQVELCIFHLVSQVITNRDTLVKLLAKHTGNVSLGNVYFSTLFMNSWHTV